VIASETFYRLMLNHVLSQSLTHSLTEALLFIFTFTHTPPLHTLSRGRLIVLSGNRVPHLAVTGKAGSLRLAPLLYRPKQPLCVRQ